ncbi:MAG TPA: LuxR C-terminal-related transcriptional regulator [Rubrobacteraceae bacterium]|nr:LuxR C-terminal-related transcriptional regulator [Rubrobacteraceae bacterium]
MPTAVPQELVTTKLRPPRTRPKLVARPRLRGVLANTNGRRLTLLSAPAGFGKSTLLSEWSQSCADGERSITWVSLDEGDNDPARFLSYLVAALRTIEEGIGEAVLASLRSPESPRPEALAGSLVNEMAALPGELAVVLDDYHVVDAQPVHGIVSFLLDNLPPNVHLVIASRVDPPLPLARLRARDQMVELHASDLRFTPEEAAAFLEDVMGLDLSAEDVSVLEERTEGWIAGLQLAALSMRDREDVSGFVEAFSGSHRDVLDFLAEEVLKRQPAEVRGFLLSTSVLERMSAPLCDALTGRSGGQEMLERLERENLFVVALDGERRWYRYHHLFAEFLKSRLVREEPERVGELHLCASGWYEDNGLLSEAIEHAFSTLDYERAARLVERGIREVFPRRGEVPTVLRWLEALPAETKRRRPWLLVEHAVALAVSDRPGDVEPVLQEIERAAETADEKDRQFLRGCASAVRSWRARLRGDAPHAVELARQSLSLLPAEDTPQRTFAAICLGEALRTSGDLAAASEAFAEAVELGRSAGHIYGTLISMVWQARVQAAQGRLREAEGSFRRALRFVTEQGVELLPAAGLAHLGMGTLLYERNDLDGAEHELEKGIRLAELTREVSNLVWGYVTLSRAKLARGDEDGALVTAHEAELVARSSGADLESAIATAWMVRLRLARGELAEAVALEQERAANAQNAADAARVVDRLTSARVLHARGRRDEALGLLEVLRDFAETSGVTGGLIEILALQALVLWANNEKEKAVSTLTRALALAEPEGFVRTIVNEGPAMADLLSATLEAGQRGRLDSPVSAHYLRKLLAALERDASGSAQRDARIPEPLSEREMEVLVLIAAGKRNLEIARELFVVLSTVKTHVQNIYRKLGARNRAQAVSRAREMNLL